MSYRRLRVTTKGQRVLVDDLYVRWQGPDHTYEGNLTNLSAEGLTITVDDDLNHTLRIPASVILQVEDIG